MAFEEGSIQKALGFGFLFMGNGKSQPISFGDRRRVSERLRKCPNFAFYALTTCQRRQNLPRVFVSGPRKIRYSQGRRNFQPFFSTVLFSKAETISCAKNTSVYFFNRCQNGRDFDSRRVNSIFSLSLQSGETSEKTPWDDEDGDDEKLRALAKKFEQKYVSCTHRCKVNTCFCSRLKIPQEPFAEQKFTEYEYLRSQFVFLVHRLQNLHPRSGGEIAWR